MDVQDFLTTWNLPGWGIFGLMIITLIKTWPIIQRNVLEARTAREGRYSARISELEDSVEECRKECDEHKEILRREITGLRRQHLSEQLQLVRTIADLFPDAPQLGLLLRTLESGQRSAAYMDHLIREDVDGPLGDVTGDAAKTP